MTDLAGFLLARIAEDEADARAAVRGFTTGTWAHDGSSIYAGHASCDVVDRVDNEAWSHIARHDPARVLADCQAKRRIVEQYRAVVDSADRAAGTLLAGPSKVQIGACSKVLRLLGLPYANHSDYREEWRP